MKSLWEKLSIGILSVTMALAVYIWNGLAKDVEKVEQRVVDADKARLEDHDSIIEMRTNMKNIYSLLADMNTKLDKNNGK